MGFLVIPETIGGKRLAKPFNDNFNAITEWANGKIGAGCLGADSVNRDNIVNSAVNTPKIEDKAVTLAKLEDAAKVTHIWAGSLSAGTACAVQGQWYDGQTLLADWTPAINMRVLFMGTGVFQCSSTLGAGIMFCGLTSNTGNVAPNIVNNVSKVHVAANGDAGKVPISLSGFLDVTAGTKYTFRTTVAQSCANNATVWVHGSVALLGVPR